MAIDKIESAGLATNTNQPNFRNIIINGDMSAAQRATSAASLTGSSYETVDRFKQEISSMGTWTQSQSTTVPTGQGFATSLKMDCTTADASPGASDYIYITQKIEGQNLQYLKKGTSSAEQLTLSFWVRSNKTGTYITRLRDADNTRSTSKSYTISSADTWEKKTITFDADTTGTLNNDNGTSLQLYFYLGAGTDYTSGSLATTWESNTNANNAVGQVNLADSTSNEWYVTGIQLEAGTAASDFEFLPVDVNLRRCQRYFEQMTADYPGLSASNKGNYSGTSVYFKVIKRATPTMSDVTLRNMQTSNTATVSASLSGWTTEAHARYGSTSTDGSTGDGCHIYNSNGIQADAEL
tara:strand:- start:925 stop:1983 length:1059 start_codon:yes stop_codon:yes gene_type:complete